MPKPKAYQHVDHLLRYALNRLPARVQDTQRLLRDTQRRLAQIERDSLPNVGIAGYDAGITLVPFRVSDPTGNAALHQIRSEWYDEYRNLYRAQLTFQRELTEYGLVNTMAGQILRDCARHHAREAPLVFAHYREDTPWNALARQAARSPSALYTAMEHMLAPYERIVQQRLTEQTLPIIFYHYSHSR